MKARGGAEGQLTAASGDARASKAQLIAAFAATWLIWGSTYLGIRFAIETMPPFLMAGSRFLIAGGIILVWARWRTGERTSPAQWRSAAIIGTLLLMGGNGAVTWAEQRVPSGVAALMVAITPCLIVLLDWLRPRGTRPTGQTVAGLVLGLAGVALLIGPDSLLGGGRIDPLGAAVLFAGSLSWSSGSIYARHAPAPRAPLLFTGMQMLCGGTVLTLAGLLAGEAGRVDLAGISLKSFLSFAYLIVFGAIVGYTAYIWLMRVTTPARATTYAYVNPVVAVLLGWMFAGESLTGRMLVAAAVIIAGVALISGVSQAQARRDRPPSTGPHSRAQRVHP